MSVNQLLEGFPITALSLLDKQLYFFGCRFSFRGPIQGNCVHYGVFDAPGFER